MAGKKSIHEGVIRPSLVGELEVFLALDTRASTYYLGLNRAGDGEDETRAGAAEGLTRDDRRAARCGLKETLRRERVRTERLDLPQAAPESLVRGWELVQERAPAAVGERHSLGLACFVVPGRGDSRLLLPARPLCERAGFEDRFVLWPLLQILDRSDRHAICLTGEDEARVFLDDLGRSDEANEVIDEIAGRVRFPDPRHELEYLRQIREHTHHHFDRVAGALLRLLRTEPFEHLPSGACGKALRLQVSPPPLPARAGRGPLGHRRANPQVGHERFRREQAQSDESVLPGGFGGRSRR